MLRQRTSTPGVARETKRLDGVGKEEIQASISETEQLESAMHRSKPARALSLTAFALLAERKNDYWALA